MWSLQPFDSRCLEVILYPAATSHYISLLLWGWEVPSSMDLEVFGQPLLPGMGFILMDFWFNQLD